MRSLRTFLHLFNPAIPAPVDAMDVQPRSQCGIQSDSLPVPYGQSCDTTNGTGMRSYPTRRPVDTVAVVALHHRATDCRHLVRYRSRYARHLHTIPRHYRSYRRNPMHWVPFGRQDGYIPHC
jgi:hypothetical protein